MGMGGAPPVLPGLTFDICHNYVWFSASTAASPAAISTLWRRVALLAKYSL